MCSRDLAYPWMVRDLLGGTAATGRLLVDDSAGLPAAAPEVTVGDPLFTNAAGPDCRLTPALPVDYCETLAATPPFDIDLDTRPCEWLDKTALYGPVDLAADELGNTIFHRWSGVNAPTRRRRTWPC